MLFVSKTYLDSFFICRHIILLFRTCRKCTTFNSFCQHFSILFKKLAKKLAKMSPKTSPPQTLVALRFKALFFLIWHSALKRGVVVAPQILDFSAEKSPQVFLTCPFFWHVLSHAIQTAYFIPWSPWRQETRDGSSCFVGRSNKVLTEPLSLSLPCPCLSSRSFHGINRSEGSTRLSEAPESILSIRA